MRIFLASVGAGAGHTRAAEAVARTAAGLGGFETRHLDILKTTSRAFRKVYADSYLWLAARAPAVWGLLYRSMGKPRERAPLDRLVRSYDRVSYERFARDVVEFAPDAVVCTHFLPAAVLAARRAAAARRLYVVVTDFDVHSFWIVREAAGYFVASDEVALQLERMGIARGRIRVTGIPVLPEFASPPSRSEACRRMGVDPTRRRVLLMAGGFGLTDLGPAIDRLLDAGGDFDLVAVAGRNAPMRRRLADRARGSRGRLRVHGFVKNMPDFLAASNLVVTKAGGLTVSECLAVGLPMVIFAPIPGQEEHNTDYLLERGAAVKARSPDLVDFKVRETLEDPERMDKMRKAARAIARPNAARDLLRAVADDARSTRR